jgi:L-ascorbate metabolism protein UlaG (beta-lactamase superfamily)
MSVEIQWIHHASFRIAGGGGVLYIDPWKLQNAPHDADAVFVSHSHYDHCSPADIEKVSKEDTTIVAPAETIPKLPAANPIEPGERISIGQITVEAVAAYNISKAFHPKPNRWCGAVFSIEGKRIYYAGDTDLIPEMSDLRNVDVALLPVGGTYTLDATSAADACKVIGCREAVPYHWGDIVGSLDDAQKFAETAASEVHLLQPGESVSI